MVRSAPLSSAKYLLPEAEHLDGQLREGLNWEVLGFEFRSGKLLSPSKPPRGADEMAPGRQCLVLRGAGTKAVSTCFRAGT